MAGILLALLDDTAVMTKVAEKKAIKGGKAL